MCLKCILDKDAAEDKMATRCTGKPALEQHSRYCPESLERREIERLKEEVQTWRKGIDRERKEVQVQQDRVIRFAARAMEAEERVRELKAIISKMHTIISKYVAS